MEGDEEGGVDAVGGRAILAPRGVVEGDEEGGVDEAEATISNSDWSSNICSNASLSTELKDMAVVLV